MYDYIINIVVIICVLACVDQELTYENPTYFYLEPTEDTNGTKIDDVLKNAPKKFSFEASGNVTIEAMDNDHFTVKELQFHVLNASEVGIRMMDRDVSKLLLHRVDKKLSHSKNIFEGTLLMSF